jgi:hypothetical protein
MVQIRNESRIQAEKRKPNISALEDFTTPSEGGAVEKIEPQVKREDHAGNAAPQPDAKPNSSEGTQRSSENGGETRWKQRGRKSKFSRQVIDQAVQMKGAKMPNNEIARVLYGVNATTPGQRRSVPTILKYHARKMESKNRFEE